LLAKAMALILHFEVEIKYASAQQMLGVGLAFLTRYIRLDFVMRVET
jgi:hypothetical protein